MSELTAYHEAGHAWMAVLCGAQVVSVTIAPDWDDGPEVLVSLAGPVAEMAYQGDPYHPGFVAEWAHDWQAAWYGSASLAPDEARRMRYLEDRTRELRQLVDESAHWAAIAEIADLLLAHQHLEGEAVVECMQQWLHRP